MTALKTLIISFILLVLTKQSCGQSLALFDTKLYANKVTLCDLLNKYVNTKQDFKFNYFDSSFFSVSSYDNHSEIFGYWNFIIRHDSLNQYGFSSLTLPINSGWFNKLYKLADSTIKIFTNKFGKPEKDTLDKKLFYQNGKKYLPGVIIEAMWLIEGQKLKVEFAIDGEHNDFAYLLKIERFKDYYGNIKLPPWWDGF